MSKKAFDELNNLLEKYQAVDLKNIFESREKHFADAIYRAGIIGDNFQTLACVTKLIPSLKEFLDSANRSFCFIIAKGSDNFFEGLVENETHRKFSLDELSDLLMKMPSFDSENDIDDYKPLPPLFGKIFVNDDLIGDWNIVAVGSVQDFEEFDLDKILLGIDEVHVVLSALKLLSAAEKNLVINKLKSRQREYLLLRSEMLNESDKAQVIEAINNFDGDRKITPLTGNKAYTDLRDSWQEKSKDIKKLAEIRQDVTINYVKENLAKYLTDLSKTSNADVAKTQVIIQKLSAVKQSIPAKEERTTIFLSRDFIAPMKNSTQQELLNFYNQIRENLREGIAEESNVAKLREALPYYVNGSWQEFLEKHNEKLGSQASKATAALTENICESIDDLLQMYLSGDEYEEMRVVIENISAKTSKSGASDSPFDNSDYTTYPVLRKEKKSISRMLPGVFLTLGGLSLLGGIFLPAVLFGAAGYNTYSHFKDEQKEKLLAESLQLSEDCYRKAKNFLDEGFADIDKQIKSVVAESYNEIVEEILKILKDYDEKHQNLIDKLSEMDGDIALLSDKN